MQPGWLGGWLAGKIAGGGSSGDWGRRKGEPQPNCTETGHLGSPPQIQGFAYKMQGCDQGSSEPPELPPEPPEPPRAARAAAGAAPSRPELPPELPEPPERRPKPVSIGTAPSCRQNCRNRPKQPPELRPLLRPLLTPSTPPGRGLLVGAWGCFGPLGAASGRSGRLWAARGCLGLRWLSEPGGGQPMDQLGDQLGTAMSGPRWLPRLLQDGPQWLFRVDT